MTRDRGKGRAGDSGHVGQGVETKPRLAFRGKAILFLIPVILLMSGAGTYQSIRTQRALLKDEIIKRGETLAAVAARNAELAILSGNRDLLERVADSLKGVRDVASIGVYDRSGSLLARRGVEVPPNLPVGTEERNSGLREGAGFFHFVAPVFTVRAGAEIDMFQEVPSARPIEERIGWARVSISREVLRRGEAALVRDGILLALLFAGTGMVFLWILVTIGTRPLRDLIQATKGLRRGDYSEFQVLRSGDEFGQLSQEFSRMSTAIRERETKLRASERRLRSLFERVEHAIFRLDPDGTILERNRKFDELFPGRMTFDSLFPEGRSGWAVKALAGEMRNVEEKLAGAGGAERTVMMSLYPDVDEKGTVTGFDGYLVDITEKKKLEDALSQTQRLESIGLLAGGIAHDFSNIITGILGYAALVKMGVSGNGPTSEYAEKIEQSATRAATLTRQLLGFARKGKFKVEPVAANELTSELVSFLQETFDRSIEIRVETEESLPAVLGDSTQLYQALMNLCINARDAMPSGGLLTLKTETWSLAPGQRIEWLDLEPGEYVRVTVSDTGVGMSPEVRKRVFEPFFTTKEVGKGTGLGLSMVYGIAKNHGGYVDIQSEPGTGTSVSLYLPTASGSVPEERKTEGAAPTEGTATVLFIDDEPALRQLVRQALERRSYRVFVAEDGIEGVRIFEEQKEVLDLVILDMNMPRKNGRQVFEEIRAVKPDAKILLCSGYGEEAHFDELFRKGAAGFVQKPFLSEELLREVENALAA